LSSSFSAFVLSFASASFLIPLLLISFDLPVLSYSYILLSTSSFVLHGLGRLHCTECVRSPVTPLDYFVFVVYYLAIMSVTGAVTFKAHNNASLCPM
jgi:hypothetical protein